VLRHLDQSNNTPLVPPGRRHSKGEGGLGTGFFCTGGIGSDDALSMINFAVIQVDGGALPRRWNPITRDYG